MNWISFNAADTVVWGEGELVCLDLLKKIEAKEELPKLVTADVIKDLDSLPFTDRGLFNDEFEKNNPFLSLGRPFHSFNFSRGCSYLCSFCLESKNLLWHGQRLRSPEKCIEEIVQVMPAGGSMMIHDDNFPPKRKWIEKFITAWDASCLPRIPFWCQMRANFICKNEDLIEELARLGMTWCSIGIEGGQRMLDFYNKKVTKEQVIEACEILHKHDINIFGNYIMGAPTETKADVDELETMLEQIKPEHHSGSTYTAYPGSILYDYCVDNNLLVGTGETSIDHYSMTRFPYERKIVGIDYDYVRAKQAEFSTKYKGELREYKKKIMNKVTCANITPEPPPPKVTVITLSHNRPDFLKEAIESIKQQTLTDWEMIIIDDFSTDAGVVPVLEEASKDPRIQTFQANYDVNNISVLWNKALDISRGKYICFLDDDNKKRPEFMSKMSTYLDEHPEHDAVACYNGIVQFSGSQMGGVNAVFDQPKSMTKDNITQNNHVDSGIMMIRRELIQKIGWLDERLLTEEDWDYVIRIMKESNGFGVIHEILAEYRWHTGNRIYSGAALNLSVTTQFIRNEKRYGIPYKVMLFHQATNSITLSQNNVLRGAINALRSIEWLEVDIISAGSTVSRSDYDLILVFMPFSIAEVHIEALKGKAKKIAFYNCEDPQAEHLNVPRAKHADYIFTNDISMRSEYENIVGKGNVAYSPSISVDNIGLRFRNKVTKKYDVIFYGYAYDSRVNLMRELATKQINGKIVLVGGGWEGRGIPLPYIGEKSEQESIEVMEEAKIIIMHNRQRTDAGGLASHKEPQSMVRGYFEAAAGSLIMLDNGRNHHSLEDDIVFYSGVDDLAAKINEFLENDRLREAIAKRAKEHALKDFTYKTRMIKMINAVRSWRYYYEVL